MADMASGYVVNARTLSATRELADRLQTALKSRIVIEQANGVLAERRGEAPGEAFSAMRSYARATIGARSTTSPARSSTGS